MEQRVEPDALLVFSAQGQKNRRCLSETHPCVATNERL